MLRHLAFFALLFFGLIGPAGCADPEDFAGVLEQTALEGGSAAAGDLDGDTVLDVAIVAPERGSFLRVSVGRGTHPAGDLDLAITTCFTGGLFFAVRGAGYEQPKYAAGSSSRSFFIRPPPQSL